MGRSLAKGAAIGACSGLPAFVLFCIFQNKVPYVVMLAISLLLGVSIGGLIAFVMSRVRRRKT